eukprot:2903164-Rhodomonas_salina.1
MLSTRSSTSITTRVLRLLSIGPLGRGPSGTGINLIRCHKPAQVLIKGWLHVQSDSSMPPLDKRAIFLRGPFALQCTAISKNICTVVVQYRLAKFRICGLCPTGSRAANTVPGYPGTLVVGAGTQSRGGKKLCKAMA